MLYLREAQAEARRAGLRAYTERVKAETAAIAAAWSQAIEQVRPILARVAEQFAHVARTVAPWMPVLLPIARAQQYGFTGPTLTGRELAHWRRHAGCRRRRQR